MSWPEDAPESSTGRFFEVSRENTRAHHTPSGGAPRCSVLHAITEDRAAPAPHTRVGPGEVPHSRLPQPGLVANSVVVCVVDLRTTSGSKV